jgi:hypothetical protein
VTFSDHAAGFTWIASDPAFMQRACHALVDDGRIWLIDPVDVSGLDGALHDRGRVEAVVQLLDRHPRDCATVASRLGVPHLRLPTEMPDSPFEVAPVVSFPKWREVSLWWPATRTLVVPEAVGTASYFRATSDRLGVHPMLRLVPPRRLRRFAPDLLLVGHGAPLSGPGTAEALSDALRTSRRRIPELIVGLHRTRGRSSG